VDGVVEVAFPEGETVAITVDDAKTSTPVVVDALKKGGYSVKQTMETPSR
jgi:hypothetical protein